MNNFELNSKACALSDSRSGYSLAREVLELRAERDKLASLAAERGQFIRNGVELGYIRLPDKDTPDSATDTYNRCLLDDASAAEQSDAEIAAEYVEAAIGHIESLLEAGASFDEAAETVRKKSQEAPHESP